MRRRVRPRKRPLWIPLLVVLLLVLIGSGAIYFLFFGKPRLTAIDIGHPLPIPYGGSRQLTATGHFNDKKDRDISATVAWRSSDRGIAQIDPSPDKKGLVIAVSPGQATITATDPKTGITAETGVSVLLPKLISLAVTPAETTLSLGGSQALKAIGTFADGSKKDVTTAVRWLSSAPDVADLDGESASPGFIKTVGLGRAVITAQDVENQVSSEAVLNVSAARLAVVTISPATVSAFKGETIVLEVTGIFSDGSTRDISGDLTWSSSNATVAVFGQAEEHPGIIAREIGSAVITATAPGVGLSADVSVSVSAAQLVSLNITPQNTSLPAGTGKPFLVRSQYSDGSSHVLKRSIDWSSSQPAVAVFSEDENNKGYLTAKAPGKTIVTARDPKTGVKDETTVIVTRPSLSAIIVSPASLSLPLGKTYQLTATGNFTDGSSRDLTNTLVWQSSSPVIASMGISGGAGNMIRTLAMGAATITAKDPESKLEGVSRLTVTAPVLTAIAINPDRPSVPVGGALQLKATGTFSDESTKEVTDTLQWRISKATIASLGDDLENKGLLRANSTGSAIVTAQDPMSGLYATTSVQVGSAELVSIKVSPPNPNVPLGAAMTLVAMGEFTDGHTAEVSSDIQWQSSTPKIAAFTTASGDIKALAVGRTTVTGIHTPSGKQFTAILTVTEPIVDTLKIEPQNPSVYLGNIQQFKALAVFSNGETSDVTRLVDWSSSDPTITSIRNNVERKGLATALAVGKVTITATDAASGMTGSTTMHGRVDWK